MVKPCNLQILRIEYVKNWKLIVVLGLKWVKYSIMGLKRVLYLFLLDLWANF